MGKYMHLFQLCLLLQCLFPIATENISQTESTTLADPSVTSRLSDQNTTFQNNSVQRQGKGRYAYLYHNLKKYFLKWYLPLVLTLGIFGTVFCLIFLFLSRLFPVNMLIWLVSICVGDFLVLVLEGVWMLLKVWRDLDIRDYNTVGCKLHLILSNYMFYWSAYMQTMLSLQRAYLIIRPIQARSNGPSISWLVLIWIGLSILLIFPVLPYAIFYDIRKNSYHKDDCDPPEGNNEVFQAVTLIDFILWGLIPLIGMTSATAIICWNIFRVRHTFGLGFSVRSRTTSATSPLTGTPFLSVQGCTNTGDPWAAQMRLRTISLNNQPARLLEFLQDRKSLQRSPVRKHGTRSVRSTESINTCGHIPLTVHLRGNATSAYQRTCRRRRNQGQRHGPTDNAGHVTRLLISMNIWYVISTFPQMIYLMILNFKFGGEKDDDIHRFLYYLSRSLCFLNACSNWIFYCASGRLFRQSIRQIFRRFFRRLHMYSASHSSVPAEHGFHIRNQYYTGADPSAGNRLTVPLGRSVVISRLNSRHFNQIQSVEFLPVGSEELRSGNLQMTCGNFFGRLNCLFPKFQCHCLCVSPFGNTGTPSRTTNESAKHLSEDTNGTKAVNKCGLCCTGICCWKFWWYGLKAGRIRKESLREFPAASSSSSLHYPTEMFRRHSQLRARDSGTRCLAKSIEREYESWCKKNRSHPTAFNQDRGYSNGKTSRRPEWFYSIPADLPKIAPVHRSKTPPYGSQILVEPFSDHLLQGLPLNSNCYCYTASVGKRKYRYYHCKLHETFYPPGDADKLNKPGSLSNVYTVNSADHVTPPFRKLSWTDRSKLPDVHCLQKSVQLKANVK
ncbi:hypothetical protein CSKR_108673 [Clonorchis sinensis]|uniref:G-protein coupled receptors family 1 profile domain-containing protein n=2 Tax=Clonorchis sinensis TaxID=79923 RepID=A0A8T1MYT9_CLOSI|nr:hypothetical protein CSKR_108673 [Clonorchis sinensis]